MLAEYFLHRQFPLKLRKVMMPSFHLFQHFPATSSPSALPFLPKHTTTTPSSFSSSFSSTRTFIFLSSPFHFPSLLFNFLSSFLSHSPSVFYNLLRAFPSIFFPPLCSPPFFPASSSPARYGFWCMLPPPLIVKKILSGSRWVWIYCLLRVAVS